MDTAEQHHLAADAILAGHGKGLYGDAALTKALVHAVLALSAPPAASAAARRPRPVDSRPRVRLHDVAAGR